MITIRMYTIYLSVYLSDTFHCQKVRPDGSGLASMLSAVGKRDVCSHVTDLRIKIIILHKF